MIWQALAQGVEVALVQLQQLAVLPPVATFHLGAEARIAGDAGHDGGVAACLAQAGALAQLEAQQPIFRQQGEFRRAQFREVGPHAAHQALKHHPGLLLHCEAHPQLAAEIHLLAVEMDEVHGPAGLLAVPIEKHRLQPRQA